MLSASPGSAGLEQEGKDMTQLLDHADTEAPWDGTYLAAWALTREEREEAGHLGTPDAPDGEVVISREVADAELGGDPEPAIDAFDGDFGPDRYHFDQDAADALLESHGYRRIGPWVEGSMDARIPFAMPTEGRSCEVVRVSADAW